MHCHTADTIQVQHTVPEKWTKAFRQSYLMNRPLLQDLFLVKYFRLLTLNDISAN